MSFFEALVIASMIHARPGWTVARVEWAPRSNGRYIVRACYGAGAVWIDIHEFDPRQVGEQLVWGEGRAVVVHAIGAGRAEAWPRQMTADETAEGSGAE